MFAKTGLSRLSRNRLQGGQNHHRHCLIPCHSPVKKDRAKMDIVDGVKQQCLSCPTLRKHAFSNILKILPPKNGNFFQIKNSDIFHISAQNIDCGYSLELPRRGGSNEYPQSMFLSRNNKNNVYPCKPQFYYIKVGFKGVKII